MWRSTARSRRFWELHCNNILIILSRNRFWTILEIVGEGSATKSLFRVAFKDLIIDLKAGYSFR